MDVQYWSQLSQIFIAVGAAIASIFAFIEYERSQRNKRIDLSLAALRGWDDKINKYTSPAIALVSDFGDNENVLNCLKENQPIKLSQEQNANRRYSFLINSEGEIPGEIVNELRLSLVHYINACEFIAELYNEGRGDRGIIETQFNPSQKTESVISRIEPFMELYGPVAWIPLKEMVAKFRS